MFPLTGMLQTQTGHAPTGDVFPQPPALLVPCSRPGINSQEPPKGVRPLATSPPTHPFSEGTTTGTPAPANCAFSPGSCYSGCPGEENKAALSPGQ